MAVTASPLLHGTRATDRGRTWAEVSLGGEVDFHRLGLEAVEHLVGRHPRCHRRHAVLVAWMTPAEHRNIPRQVPSCSRAACAFQ